AIVKVFSQTWIDYRNSPVVAESASACDRAPYGVFEEEQTGKMSLFDLLKGTEYHVLIFEGLQPDPKFSILQKELFDLLARYKVAVCIHLITNKNDNLHQQYGAQTSCLFLIRPDGHIAFQGQLLKLDDFEAYLDKWFTQQELLSLKE
ncbi:MAG: hypothetical protein ACREPR_11705, partial [Brasilonema sp.]